MMNTRGSHRHYTWKATLNSRCNEGIKSERSYLFRLPDSRCTFLLGLSAWCASCLSVCVCVMDVCDCLFPLDSSGSPSHAPCELWLVGGGKGQGLRDFKVGNIQGCEVGEQKGSQSHLESVCACSSATRGLVFSREE